LKNDTSYFESIQSQFKSEYRDEIFNKQADYDDISQKFPLAQQKIKDILQSFKEVHTLYKVYAVLNNPGGSEVSVKRPGLLRVYIGPGNYVDLKLLASDEKQTLDVPPHGSVPVMFISGEAATFPPDDQKLISQYWNGSVSAVLFVEDTFGIVRTSNRVPFADSTYQKSVYDRLAGEAAKPIHFAN
jgi:hypothetical protein